MRVNDLNLNALLEFEPDGGIIRFAGQRGLLVDAVAMGLLRKYLIENFGRAPARAVLTQFGFAYGWRMAETMKSEFDWENDDDWRQAGTRIHTLQGLFRVNPESRELLSDAGIRLIASYEAEQHILHFGRSEVPMCWTISGLTSGYMSRSTGKEIYVLENKCMSKGDSSCQLVGRTREAWGEERAEDLRFFEGDQLQGCLDVSLQRVKETLKAAERRLEAHHRVLSRLAPEVEDPLRPVAKSTPMQNLMDLAHRVARVDAAVLITGESGVGKERIAQLIHDESPRAAGPFIAINCGALTETLLESELFGHARGAFTGADHDRPGLFEAANTGTLLLDEVSEISSAMQVKLLRVLQEKEIRRVGENRNRPIDVRVLAATNRDLAHEVEGGSFRQDLYYRLNVIALNVPPLRERRDDILPLARILLAEAALRMKRDITGLTPSTADLLRRYNWPGNVRELKNAMERAAALARGSRVAPEDLPEELRQAFKQPLPAEEGTVRPLCEVEKDYILAALEFNEGNQTRTAEQLGIGSATLYRRLKSYGMTQPRARA